MLQEYVGISVHSPFFANYGRKCILSASYVRVSVYLLNYCLTQVIVYVVQ